MSLSAAQRLDCEGGSPEEGTVEACRDADTLRRKHLPNIHFERISRALDFISVLFSLFSYFSFSDIVRCV